jgi:prefoldin subunit 5
MASGIFKNIVDKCGGLVGDISKGIKQEGTKTIKTDVLKQLPTPDQITAKFKVEAEKDPIQAKKYYDNTKNKLETLQDRLENSRKKLEKLEDKLSQVDNQINRVNKITDTIRPFIPLLQTALIAANATIAASATPGATPVGIRGSEFKRKATGFIKILIQLLLIAPSIVDTINKSVDKARNIIPNAIQQIENLIELIQSLLKLLDNLFINLLSPLLEGYEEINGGISDVEELFDQYPDLETYLNSEGNINLSDEELPSGVTNGISNVPPKFFRRYRKGPYTDIY